MEKVWGPVNGLYITAYAAPTGEGERFCSYAKVCALPPASYWEARDVIFKIAGGEYHRSPEVALLAAQMAARNTIGRIPASAITLLELGLRMASRQVMYSIGKAIRARTA
jgi:hypothetical protein